MQKPKGSIFRRGLWRLALLCVLVWLSVFSGWLWANVNDCRAFFPVKSSANKYDLLIRRNVGRYMPGVDWRRFKAQLATESSFNASAVSPVGAAGLAQIMPGTALYLSDYLPYRVDPFNARHAIEAGSLYMGQLRRQWRLKRPERDRQQLAESSYNAGLGHILAAQQRCDNARLYQDIIQCLPHITGKHAKETIDYVIRIDCLYRRLKFE